MTLDAPDFQAALAGWLAKEWGAGAVRISGCRRLVGGAIQENWALDATVEGGRMAGAHALVLRTDAPSGLSASHSRVEEYAILKAAFDSGVTVPEPLAACSDRSVLGKDFVVMRRVQGVAVGPRVARDEALGGDREALVERLGAELARIHSITPETHRFDFLCDPAPDRPLAELIEMLDSLGEPRPALEWGLRWLARRRPASEATVLAHRDFRTGNYMVDSGGLTAILDWEFACWSEPHEDLGWFCAMCWRFGRRDRPAGGVGSREAFYRGYEWASGRSVDPRRVYWWEVFAHIRWALLAIQQGHRFLKGGERTLDIVLTGRRPPEMELEVLHMTHPDDRAQESAA